MMAMASNLAKHGRAVTVFGDYAYALRSWFPGVDIRPSLSESDAAGALAGFDCAAQMHVGWPYALHDHARSYFYYDAHVVITGKGFVKVNQISDFVATSLVWRFRRRTSACVLPSAGDIGCTGDGSPSILRRAA